MFIGRGKTTQGGTVGNLKSIRIFAAVLLSLPLVAHAAGLGQLKVLSGLGQPLNAEIEIVSLQPGEDDSLGARLASAEAFRQAGVEFNPILLGVRLNIIRRDGKPVLRLSTVQPVNEPFLELLVELQWATGRLVREYTFLLDPPEYKGPQPIAAAPPVAAPVPAPAPAPAAVPAAPATQPITQPITRPAPPAEAAPPRAEERPVAPAPAPGAPAKPMTAEGLEDLARRNMMGWETRWGWQGSGTAVSPQPAAVAGAGTHEVRKGETLGEIAMRNAQPGVSKNQMMIAIFRANPDAFIDDNINLVREGRILAIPDIDAAGAIEGAEATRVVGEHMTEFAAYQRKVASAVAAAPATTTPGDRAASGAISAKPPAPAPAPQTDQLKLAQADPAKPAAGATVAARGDDSVARERALKEAQSRVAELEKNVTDLRKLLELKNQQLAELEKQAGAKPGAVAPAAKAPEKPAPVAAPTPAVEAPKPAVEAPKPAVEAPKPVAEAPKPAVEAPAPVAEAPKPKPKPKPVPPMVQETSLVDEFLENPIALGGLGGVMALLLGYGAWAWRRKKNVQAKAGMLGATSMGAASVFNAASGPSSQTSGPQSGPRSGPQSQGGAAGTGVETDEVDPIAEADVYMAYGRDAQAEEILREALQKDPGRVPVHAKLLDIFANRRDRPAFEKTALQLRTLTGGAGAEWEKALTLGRSIDPQNALYGGTPDSTLPRFAAPGAAPTLDFDLDSVPGEAPEPDLPLDVDEKRQTAESVDFDLGSDQAEERSDFTPEGTLITDEKKGRSGGLDFDLGTASKPGDSSIDFELPSTEGGDAPSEEAATADAGLDFKLDLDTGETKADEPRGAATQPVDLASISLDLDSPSKPSSEPTTSTDPKWQEVATKLDLAKAYEEMGDKDGARELLNEVMKEGDAAQQSQARQMLSNLG